MGICTPGTDRAHLDEEVPWGRRREDARRNLEDGLVARQTRHDAQRALHHGLDGARQVEGAGARVGRGGGGALGPNRRRPCSSVSPRPNMTTHPDLHKALRHGGTEAPQPHEAHAGGRRRHWREG